MATNLFDFNAFGTPGNSVADRFVSGLQNTPATPQFQPTGGGMMPPTPSMKPLPPNPIIAKPKAVVAQPAAKGDLFQQYLDDPTQDQETKKTMLEAVQGGEDPQVFIDALTKGGYGAPKPVAPEAPKGFLDSVGEDLQNRAAGFQKVLENPDFSGATKTFKLITSGLGLVGDVVGEGISAITPDVVKEKLSETAKEAWDMTPKSVQNFAIESIKEGVDGWKQFEEKFPELATNIGSSFELAGVIPAGKAGQVGGKVIKKGAEKVLEELTAAGERLATSQAKRAEERVIGKVGADTIEGVIDGQKVNIPKPRKTIGDIVTMPIKAAAYPFREADPKVLAGRALTPSIAGKSAAQKLDAVKSVERNTKELYKKVRTGEFTGDLSTLETGAQTVLDNLKTTGAKIGDAISKVKGEIPISLNWRSQASRVLKNEVEQVSAAYPVLQEFYNLTKKSRSIKDTQRLKTIFSDKLQQLVKGGDTGSDSYKFLRDGVEEVNRKIEDVIETRLGPGFVKEKQNYKLLKTIVNDIVNSAVVEGRRAPMTLPEQIGTIEAIVEGISNPLSATRKAFAKEIGEMNTRGGSWKQLIDLYDQEAIKSAKVIKKPVGKTIKKPPSNTNPLDFSKNKGGFINPRKIAEDTGIMAKPKYKTAMDALNDPEFQAKYAAIEARRKILKPTKTSNNLYHTTRAENIESIMKQGLTSGNKPRYEGVSGKKNISFSANEVGASVFGAPGDVMIRTKTSYKPTDLKEDFLSPGDYITSKNIPPDFLEVKVKGKWIPLKDYKK